MSISIDKTTCIGCGACVEACPGNLLKLGDDKRAFSRDPKDCWGCTACMKECPVGAIAYFLGADMGGRGMLMTVRANGNIKTWSFTRSDATVQTIAVDSSQSNRY